MQVAVAIRKLAACARRLCCGYGQCHSLRLTSRCDQPRSVFESLTMSRRRKKMSKSTRRRVMRRDLWLCTLRFNGCTGHATELDHIKPVSAGGDNSADNLRAVCHGCHKLWHLLDGHNNALGEPMRSNP